MKYNILTENAYIYQGLTLFEQRQLQKWERVGIDLKESQLTADQIQQLFQQIEQQATAGGDNRTALGKGKDVATAVNSAWKDLKSTIYNSGPMQGFASKYDEAVKKLKQATGGDEGAMKYVQKYRQFAEKHPILQGAVYAALIAAAGVSGAGLGGAAALGLFKLTDQLLQGKDIRSALYQGAKTGALAYGASKLGDLIRGGGADAAGAGDAASSNVPDVDPASQAKIDNLLGKYPPDQYIYQDAGAGNINILDANGQMVANADIKSTGLTGNQFVNKFDPPANVDQTSKLINKADDFGSTAPEQVTNVTPKQAAGSGSAALDDFVGGPDKFDQMQTALSTQEKNAIGQDVAKQMRLPANSEVKFQGNVPVSIDGQPVPQNIQQNYGGANAGGPGVATDVKTTTTPDGGTTTTGNLQGVTGDQIRNHPVYQAEIERGGNNPESRNAAAMKARAAILKGESRQSSGAMIKEEILYNLKPLSEGMTLLVFRNIQSTNDMMIKEGLIWELGRKPLREQEKTAWQKIKSKAADIGKNLTTKVTASKLSAAWKKANMSSDSDSVAEFLKQQGINDQVVTSVFKSMKLPAPGAGKTTAEIAAIKKELANLGPQNAQKLIDLLNQQLGTA